MGCEYFLKINMPKLAKFLETKIVHSSDIEIWKVSEFKNISLHMTRPLL